MIIKEILMESYKLLRDLIKFNTIKTKKIRKLLNI